MNPQTRMKLIRDHMRFGQKYTVPTLYNLYKQVMNSSDILIALPVYKLETIRDQLRMESRVEGSWLSVENGLYYKTEPKCLFTPIHNWIVKRSSKWMS